MPWGAHPGGELTPPAPLDLDRSSGRKRGSGRHRESSEWDLSYLSTGSEC